MKDERKLVSNPKELNNTIKRIPKLLRGYEVVDTHKKPREGTKSFLGLN